MWIFTRKDLSNSGIPIILKKISLKVRQRVKWLYMPGMDSTDIQIVTILRENMSLSVAKEHSVEMCDISKVLPT